MKNLEGLMMNQSIINNTMCHAFGAPAQIFFIVSYSLVFLVGLILNGFVLRFYLCQSQRSSSTMMVYLKNLVAADFLLCLCLPFSIVNLTTNDLTIRRAYCKAGLGSHYLNMYASILFMAHIAYNRYLKIIYPLKTHILQTARAARIVCAVTWVVLIIIVIIYSSVTLTVLPNSTSVPSSCVDLSSTKRSVLHKVIHSGILVIFLSVLIFMLYVYYRTSRTVSMAQKRQLTSSSNKKLAKSRRNMLILIIVFCVCFVPFHLIHIPYVFHGCSQTQLLYFLRELSLVLSALNVCLDPFIYFIFSKAFREQMKLRVMSSQAETPTQDTEASVSQERLKE